MSAAANSAIEAKRSLARFAMAYSEQTLRDHDRLAAAVRAGRFAVASAEEAGIG